MSYRVEFPDYPESDMPAMPAGFLDQSWKNDVCPSFSNSELRLAIWADYPDATARDFPEGERFSVQAIDADGAKLDGVQDLLVTEDWSQVLEFVVTHAAATLKCTNCHWRGSESTADESLETLPTEDGWEQVCGHMCPLCSAPVDALPATEGALCAEYTAWCSARNYPAMSADELACEISAGEIAEAREGDSAWLADFIERWEAWAEADFQAWRAKQESK